MVFATRIRSRLLRSVTGLRARNGSWFRASSDHVSVSFRIGRPGTLVTGTCLATGAAVSFVSLQPTCCEDSAASSANDKTPAVVEQIPASIDLSKTSIRLYQFESCPFCRKVRSVLDYLKIKYEVVEVHPLSKAETKDFAPDYSKVPILRIDSADQPIQLRDSKTILQALLGARAGCSEGAPPPKATPSTALMWPEGEGGGGVEDQWIKWTDRVLVQCIVINIYRNYAESAETFKYLLTHPTFSWFQQQSAAISGTVVMLAVAIARKYKYKVHDERRALYEACEEYAEAVKAKGGTFLGGDVPGLADFNVYGILRSVESFTTERDLFQNCPAVLIWYNAMTQKVGPSCAVNASSIKRGV